MPSENPLDTIVKLLRSEFNDDAVSIRFLESDIEPGSDGTPPTPPYITVSNKDESPVSGGETNTTGFAADGSGGVQVVLGTLLVECNGGHRDTPGVAQTVAFELAEEARRVLSETFVEGDLQVFEPTPPTEVTKTGREPPEHAEQFFATYEYEA